MLVTIKSSCLPKRSGAPDGTEKPPSPKASTAGIALRRPGLVQCACVVLSRPARSPNWQRLRPRGDPSFPRFIEDPRPPQETTAANYDSPQRPERRNINPDTTALQPNGSRCGGHVRLLVIARRIHRSGIRSPGGRRRSLRRPARGNRQ